MSVFSHVFVLFGGCAVVWSSLNSLSLRWVSSRRAHTASSRSRVLPRTRGRRRPCDARCFFWKRVETGVWASGRSVRVLKDHRRRARVNVRTLRYVQIGFTDIKRNRVPSVESDRRVEPRIATPETRSSDASERGAFFGVSIRARDAAQRPKAVSTRAFDTRISVVSSPIQALESVLKSHGPCAYGLSSHSVLARKRAQPRSPFNGHIPNLSLGGTRPGRASSACLVAHIAALVSCFHLC